MKLIKRPFSYLILALLCKVTPYIVSIFCIMWTQDRVAGMKMGVIPGLLIPHLIFGILFISDTKIRRYIYSIIVSGIILGTDLLLLRYNLTIETNWDMYGYWDLAIMNLISGIIIWELFFQTYKIVTRKTENG